jgi:hypothetical protein
MELSPIQVVHPSFPAIDAIAAHCDGCSTPCLRAIRTARSRTSGEYLLVVPWAPSAQRMGPLTIPVRFNTHKRGNAKKYIDKLFGV